MKLREVLKNKEKGNPENKRIAYKFFTEEKGYEPKVALGIIGNLMQESHAGLDTSAIGFDGTGSTGIAQWLGSRKEKLKEIRPNDFDTLRGQLEFIDWELNNTEKRAASKLKEAKTVEEAALTFSKYYERPHKDYAHNDKRVNFAKSLQKELGLNFEKNNIQPSKEEIETRQVAVDNTQVRRPSLATPNYTQLPELETDKQKEQQTAITEEQIRKLLAKDRKATEQRFLQAFQQQNQPQQEYIPQAEPIQEDLYNYINIEEY